MQTCESAYIEGAGRSALANLLLIYRRVKRSVTQVSQTLSSDIGSYVDTPRFKPFHKLKQMKHWRGIQHINVL